MVFRYHKIAILLISMILLVLVIPSSFGGNYYRNYSSKVQFGFLRQELHVSVPPSLYEYYEGKTIKLANDNQYAKLVTPDAVKPIAESVRNLTLDKPRSEEEFANTVLTLIHQIPYASGGVKYPVETLVENSGKCDTLSLLAASIMKAGGLDVVLLYFKGVHHISVGVFLPQEPYTTWWWLPPTGYEFDGKKYWIAECTPAMDWRVGDLPPLLEGEQPCIISLENCEESSPAHVSSKLGSPLNSSSISINLSSDSQAIEDREHALRISGSISPAYPNETVVVYFSQDGVSYNAYKTETDYAGNYSYSWNLNATGTYYVRTCWSGNSECTGADSETLTAFLGFPRSIFQFQGPNYYYTYNTVHLASHELRIRQGVEEFLDLQLSGTGVLLIGEFIVLKDEQNTSRMQMQTITIPTSEHIVRFGWRRGVKMLMPERTITVPVNIPEGMQRRLLPDDFDQTMNNKFGFILRNHLGNNYSINFKGMNDSDIAQINQV
ncbi:MAG: hypothetical protein NWE80_00760, partial [Candidatus Bathyarchaeota archaeon]|nr:hypothetical protein [Candidatus Bathyarchaeota archaeon]